MGVSPDRFCSPFQPLNMGTYFATTEAAVDHALPCWLSHDRIQCAVFL